MSIEEGEDETYSFKALVRIRTIEEARNPAQPLWLTISSNTDYDEMVTLLETNGGNDDDNLTILLNVFPHFKPSRDSLRHLNLHTEVNLVFRAIEMGHLAILKCLHACGARLIFEVWGKTVLHYACNSGHLHILTWLLRQKGINRIFNAKAFPAVPCGHAIPRGLMKTETALQVAVNHNREDMARVMLTHCDVCMTSVSLPVVMILGPGFHSFDEFEQQERLQDELSTHVDTIFHASANVSTLGEWRPSKARRFPRKYRGAMRTLLLLARARTILETN